MSYSFKRYLKKNKINPYFANKYRTISFLKKKFKFSHLFLNKKFNYHLISWKKNYDFCSSISFLIYQYNFKFLKKKFNSVKYYKLIEILRDYNYKFKIKNRFLFFKLNKLKLNFLLNYIKLYNLFFYSIFLDIFYLTKFLKKKNRLIYFLILSFKKNKLYVNLQNLNKKNYLSLSAGLFIKFFEKKKSLKKNKTIKLLMAKYIRKLFLVSKIKNVILMIKRIPVFINEIINFFNMPIAHKFINPVDGKNIEENENNFTQIKFLYFLFLENKNFSKNKIAQKGRIKRKILRKVVFENKLVD